MRFQLRAGNTTIGHSKMALVNHELFVGEGLFQPKPDYRQFQPLIQKNCAARHHANAKKRDGLILARRLEKEIGKINLELCLPAGERVATSWIHLIDFSVEFGTEGLILTACFNNQKNIESYFS